MKIKIIGDNTDIVGFELAIRKADYQLNKKIVLILGAGGVVPSIILSLKKMGVAKIYLSNRTQEKADQIQNFFQGIETVQWGEIPNFDMIINATSLGLSVEMMKL